MKDINDSAVGSYKSTSNIKPIEFSDTQILNWAESILEKRFIRSNYLTNPDMTRDYLRVALSKFEREVFLVILLDNQHGVLEAEILFQGTIDGAAVYPREVVKLALSKNAAAVIFAHNHPAGIAEPSNADKIITQRLMTALQTVDICVLDHLVVGNVDIVSFAERGLI